MMSNNVGSKAHSYGEWNVKWKNMNLQASNHLWRIIFFFKFLKLLWISDINCSKIKTCFLRQAHFPSCGICWYKQVDMNCTKSTKFHLLSQHIINSLYFADGWVDLYPSEKSGKKTMFFYYRKHWPWCLGYCFLIL